MSYDDSFYTYRVYLCLYVSSLSFCCYHEVETLFWSRWLRHQFEDPVVATRHFMRHYVTFAEAKHACYFLWDDEWNPTLAR